MVPIEEVIREGKKVDAILQQIDEDEDIAVLVLGASKEATGPGPLVSSLAAGASGRQIPDPHHHRARRAGASRTSRRWPEAPEGAGLPWHFDPLRPIY